MITFTLGHGIHRQVTCIYELYHWEFKGNILFTCSCKVFQAQVEVDKEIAAGWRSET